MLDELRHKLSQIKNMGYIKSLRKGPTGVGYTLETLLGIKENNLFIPDYDSIEIKAHRENHTGLITLFTFNKKAWIMPPLQAIRKFGGYDKNGRIGLYYTMKRTPNSAGLFVYIDNQTISVRHIDGDTIACWQLDDIADRFNQKVSNVLLITAAVEERDNVEHFYYHRFRFLSGGTTADILKSQFLAERFLIDLRLHDQGTRARNHGTAFRSLENSIPSFYTHVKEIVL